MAKSNDISEPVPGHSPANGSRIVLSANQNTSRDLADVAEKLELSKVKALQLAVQVLAEISEELSQGAELYLKRDGKRTRLWLPFFRRRHRGEPGPAKAGQTPTPSSR